MAVTLNASTSSGFIATSDTSGVLELQNNGTTRMTVNSSGVSFAAQPLIGGVAPPAFSAYLGTNQSFNNVPWTKIQFNTEEFDTNSNYDTTNYRFTPTVAGYYQITACATTTSSAGTTERIAIYKNGSIFKAGPQIVVYAEGNLVSALVYLNGTSDYVEAYYNVPGTNRTLSGTASDTYFQGVMVRGA